MSGISRVMAAVGFLLCGIIYLLFVLFLHQGMKGRRWARKGLEILLCADLAVNIFGTLISWLMLIGCGMDLVYLVFALVWMRRTSPA